MSEVILCFNTEGIMQAKLRKTKATTCAVCGLKIRGPGHEDGEHHRARQYAKMAASRTFSADTGRKGGKKK